MSRLTQPSTAPKGGSECFHCRRHHQPMPPLLGSGPQAAPDPIQNWGYKTLYNHCRRWPETGVFRLIFSELSRSRDREPEAGATPEAVLMMDATYVNVHRTASSPKKGALPLA
ncbi:MAG: hypothetical protein OXC96_04020 [Cyanobacteria bacterium MAG CAR1_bin_15]|nr:hypothetical protein [Cyanobacteria bacterium MAG CAR1_bin_15]